MCSFKHISPIFRHYVSSDHSFIHQKGGAGKFLEGDNNSNELISSSPDQTLANAARNGMKAMAASHRHLQISSWNIAAINNNPFEYWITYDENENYDTIMSNVEEFLERPGDRDVAVSQVFTDDMFGELEKRMLGVGWESVRSYWEKEFRDRKIVSGFMKVGNVEKVVDCVFFRFQNIFIHYLPFDVGSSAGKQTISFHAG